MCSLHNVNDALAQFLRVFREVLPGKRVDGEVQQPRATVSGLTTLIGDLPLQGDGLKVVGAFVEDKEGVLRRNRHQHNRGVMAPVPERFARPLAEDFAVGIGQDVVCGFRF